VKSAHKYKGSTYYGVRYLEAQVTKIMYRNRRLQTSKALLERKSTNLFTSAAGGPTGCPKELQVRSPRVQRWHLAVTMDVV